MKIFIPIFAGLLCAAARADSVQAQFYQGVASGGREQKDALGR